MNLLSRRALLVRGAAALAATACVGPSSAAPSAPVSRAPPPTPTPTGLERAIAATLEPGAWLVTERGRVRVRARFGADPGANAVARLAGAEATFAREGDVWLASLDLKTIPSGPQTVTVLERLRDGTEATVATDQRIVSAPVYVVWTIDHEGYDEPDALTANVSEVADAGIPLSILVHPRIYVGGALPPERTRAITRWVLARAGLRDEVGLHLHMQFDFVHDAGVAPRSEPRWGVGVGGDGYDVPMTAYTEEEQRRLVRRSLSLFAGAGLPRPTSFRAGGLFADAATLRAIAAEGFTVDTSATEAQVLGRLRVPWRLGPTAQPYRPNRDDASSAEPPPLELLEVPNNAGNTFSDPLSKLRERTRALWPGGPAPATRVLDYVSHPSTFDARERATVERVFAPLLDARADRDTGPVRFVRLRDLLALL